MFSKNLYQVYCTSPINLRFAYSILNFYFHPFSIKIIKYGSESTKNSINFKLNRRFSSGFMGFYFNLRNTNSLKKEEKDEKANTVF